MVNEDTSSIILSWARNQHVGRDVQPLEAFGESFALHFAASIPFSWYHITPISISMFTLPSLFYVKSLPLSSSHNHIYNDSLPHRIPNLFTICKDTF